MKFKKFFNRILDVLLYNPNINIYTVKIIIKKFEFCLSNKELNKYSYLIKEIKNFIEKQLNIEYINKKLIIKNLEKEFNILNK